MRRLLAALMLATLLLAPMMTPSAALAAPVDAPVAAPTQAPSSAYMNQLLAEINHRRAEVGSGELTYVSDGANLAVSQYLADLTPQMFAYRACFHGMNNPVPPAWDYVAASGFDAEVGGEVLGCPGEGFYWTPQQIAVGWWNSPTHFSALYGDGGANAIACGAYASGNGGRGYQTVACVTYRI